MAFASPARPFWIAFQSMASCAVGFLGSGILRPSRPSIRLIMTVLLFLLPLFRPTGFPDCPFFQECVFGGFLKPISASSARAEREPFSAVISNVSETCFLGRACCEPFLGGRFISSSRGCAPAQSHRRSGERPP